MAKFTADIGTYEKGFNVDLPEAFDIDSALSEAEKELENRYPNDTSAFIVQLFNDGKIVWDYFNGNLI